MKPRMTRSSRPSFARRVRPLGRGASATAAASAGMALGLRGEGDQPACRQLDGEAGAFGQRQPAPRVYGKVGVETLAAQRFSRQAAAPQRAEAIPSADGARDRAKREKG